MSDFLTGLVIGINLVSAHVPQEDMNNWNPGVYVRHESGWSGGVYHNSLRRTSVWAGYTFEHGPYALTVGAVSGYKRRDIPAYCTCSEFEKYKRSSSTTCYPATVEGFTSHQYTLMLTPSVKLPAVLGLTPRVSYIPRLGGPARMNVFHLSVEKTF